MFAKFVRKNVFILLLVVIILTVVLFNYANEETQEEQPKGIIGEEIVQTEFLQEGKYTPINYDEVHPQGRLIHNNGKPIKNDVLEQGGNQKLFAVFQMVFNNAHYEFHIFRPLKDMDIDEIRKETLKQKQVALERYALSKGNSQ